MSEAAAKIVRLERRVMWRQRLVALQDAFALAVMISGMVAAAFVALARLRPITLPVWTVVIGVMSLACAAALTRWFISRAREGDAAFLIDEALNLDDRVATSLLIIERGGPAGGLEEALIEDAAARIGNQRAASVVPLRARRWDTLSLVSVMGLAAAFLIPTRSIPVNETLAAERADIVSAGEQLEQTAAEIERSMPFGSETGTLANEQAEVGRGFRRSSATRAEALRRLSALEDRIRRRHDALASTRADEIVNLADRRLGRALSTLGTSRRPKIDLNESQLAPPNDEQSSASKQGAGNDGRVPPPGDALQLLQSTQETRRKSKGAASRARSEANGVQSNDEASASGQRPAGLRKRPPEPIPEKGNPRADSVEKQPSSADSTLAKETGSEPGALTDKHSDQQASGQKPGDSKVGGEIAGEHNIGERKASDQPSTELPAGSLDALKAVPDAIAEQAAKPLPRVSEELLKKAAELRAKELTPADIEKLRKAAEVLAHDLTQIAESKELQKALQEMARQIRPEQIEQVARELGNQEKLKQELEAAARLLSENQQAKQMVAGLAQQFARMRDERRQQDNGQGRGSQSVIREEEPRSGDRGNQSDRAKTSASLEKSGAATDRRLAGLGRESSLMGKFQRGSGGEYLYLQSKAGGGAARTVYSSAYPSYRREAERSVQRNQVPPGLRSVVRKYFDAINPDAKRP